MATTVRHSPAPDLSRLTQADRVTLSLFGAVRWAGSPFHERLWVYLAVLFTYPLARMTSTVVEDYAAAALMTLVLAGGLGALLHLGLASTTLLQPWFAQRARTHQELRLARELFNALEHHRISVPETTVERRAFGYHARITIPAGATREELVRTLPAVRESLRVESLCIDDATRPVPGYVDLLVIEDDLLESPLQTVPPVCADWHPTNGAYTPIPVGIDAGGRTVALPLATRAGGGRRYLVGGASGSGKNSLFTQLLVGAVRMGTDQVQLWLADLKGTEFAVYTPAAERYTWTAETAVEMLEDLAAEMRGRQTHLRRMNRTVWDADSDGPVILAAIDELTVITNNSNAALSKRGQRALVELASLSRSVGICLIVALQTPNADYIPSAARNNFDDRIAFRVANDAAAEVIIPGVSKHPEVNPANIYDEVDPETGVSLSAGVCTAEGAVGRAKRLRCWFVPTEDVPALLPALRVSVSDARNNAGEDSAPGPSAELREGQLAVSSLPEQ